MVLRLRGGDALRLASGGPDWGAMHSQAAQRAQDPVITLDLPMVQPLVAGSSSVSGLPTLLQRALLQAGDWTPGPGAQFPLGIRDFALRGPFGVPELVAAMPQPRPLNPGEEEIVIPMPLWAQMGRGQLSETDQIMASPLSPFGYAPPMGVYRLVVPGGGPVDMTGGAPPGTPGIVELLGPTGLEIMAHAGRSGVQASSLGGRQFLGRVALDDGETAITRRGRIRVGAPISSPTGSFLSQGGGAPDATAVVGAQPSMPNVPPGTYVDGTYNGAPMAAALTSAMQMRSELAARTSIPGRPATSSPSISSGSGVAAGAQSQQSAGLATLPSGAGDQTLVATAALGAQAGSAFADMISASSSVASSSSTPSFITGLQPGMWSGHRRSETSKYQSWSYSGGRDDVQRSAGGVDLSNLSRPVYPSLPTSLRFRYVGAPLWWSGSTRLGGDNDGSPANGAMRAGLRAATSAAAGTMSKAGAARARAASIEMSIVAAIPPAPPPLESMGSGMAGGNAPHARGKGHGHGGQQNQHKEASDAVSHSKIEGSVDAIAQRIYHRIRRRIQSDRERFGG
jgi:hypothetical protein